MVQVSWTMDFDWLPNIHDIHPRLTPQIGIMSVVYIR